MSNEELKKKIIKKMKEMYTAFKSVYPNGNYIDAFITEQPDGKITVSCCATPAGSEVSLDFTEEIKL